MAKKALNAYLMMFFRKKQEIQKIETENHLFCLAFFKPTDDDLFEDIENGTGQPKHFGRGGSILTPSVGVRSSTVSDGITSIQEIEIQAV